MISQTADDVLELPTGVALEMVAGQNIRLELHYINAGLEPAMAHATTSFTTMAPKDVIHAADLAFIGNADISIAPMSNFTLDT